MYNALYQEMMLQELHDQKATRPVVQPGEHVSWLNRRRQRKAARPAR
ncbi:MAG: hypothetical protein JWR90_3555 [Marmoricola sp.]|jgi:hypothetical protein|nr:hypothetical protein [Marmoricola sp.]